MRLARYIDLDEVGFGEGDEDFVLMRSAKLEQGHGGGVGVNVGDLPNVCEGCSGEDVAADQVADVDLVVGEGGAFFRGDGDVQAAQGFSVVDGVDAGEFEDDSALVEPVIFELDFARSVQVCGLGEGSRKTLFRSWNFSGKSVRSSARTSPLRPCGRTNRARSTHSSSVIRQAPRWLRAAFRSESFTPQKVLRSCLLPECPA